MFVSYNVATMQLIERAIEQIEPPDQPVADKKILIAHLSLKFSNCAACPRSAIVGASRSVEVNLKMPVFLLLSTNFHWIPSSGYL